MNFGTCLGFYKLISIFIFLLHTFSMGAVRDLTGSERFLAIMRSSVLSASYGTRRLEAVSKMGVATF